MESPTSDVPRSTPLCVVLAFAAVTLACFWPLVRHPGDVLVGSVLGTVIAQLTTRSVRRYFGWR